MRRIPLLGVAASLCVAFGAVACSSDSGGGAKSTRDEMVDDLSQTLEDGELGLDGEQSDCVAGVIVDEVGVDALKDVDLTADTPPEELREDITAAQSVASEECDLPSVSDG
jgi:hypothetical protein